MRRLLCWCDAMQAPAKAAPKKKKAAAGRSNNVDGDEALAKALHAKQLGGRQTRRPVAFSPGGKGPGDY